MDVLARFRWSLAVVGYKLSHPPVIKFIGAARYANQIATLERQIRVTLCLIVMGSDNKIAVEKRGIHKIDRMCLYWIRIT